MKFGAAVAQQVERRAVNPWVDGSSPRALGAAPSPGESGGDTSLD